ncbi:MAG: PilZ domain-containing protein [Candidatus Omnitrophica bacterium]|nr:PilZ domain-containing protein [Candidatus Omnitrophota bacterium]
MQERRKYKRIKDRLVVICKLPKNAKVEELGSTGDISSGGAKIYIPKNLAKGEKIDFDISLLNDAIPILAHGEVVWVKKMPQKKTKGKKDNLEEFIVGIRFVRSGSFDDQRIDKHIKRKLIRGDE